MSAAKTKTAADERATVRETLAWMERRVDAEVGTANDRPGDDFAGSGDPSQVGSATSSYPLCRICRSNQKYAVDGWLLASGKPPEITEVEKWYVDDSDIVFGAAGKVASTGEQRQK